MIKTISASEADSISRINPDTKQRDGSFHVYYSNGENVNFTQTNLDSISSVSKCYIEVYPNQKEVSSSGESFWVNVMSNTDWVVSSNQTWSTLSYQQGTGNNSVEVTTEPNATDVTDGAVLTFTTSDSKQTALVEITRLPNANIVRDICGNTYKVVKIGDQYWMAENYRCNKYDTESDRPNVVIEPCNQAINVTTAPYYMKYDDDDKNLKYGYVYNWPAVVALPKIDDLSEFSSQGICPNGWHVPSLQEVMDMVKYIETSCGYGSKTAAKYLRSIEGWSLANYDCWQGLDSFGFNALPCGIAANYSTGGWGINNSTSLAHFWTRTSNNTIAWGIHYSAYQFWLRCVDDEVRYLDDPAHHSIYIYDCDTERYNGYSVRCIKN